MDLTLVTLNLNYSSWSLRPKILLDYYQIPHRIQMLYKDDKKQLALAHELSPQGTLPALYYKNEATNSGPVLIVDSLAIMELLQELFPELPLWPQNLIDRALARSLACEMHSSFADLRDQMGMNIALEWKDMTKKPVWREATIKAVHRINQVWTECRARSESSSTVQDDGFLFGRFSIVDAMYTPVVWRFRTYNIVEQLSPKARQYYDKMLSLDVMQKYLADSIEEKKTHVIADYEIYV
ncbi:hypothetical protein HDV03_002385 [Kappamyces sp. JEL0829]|nr:hypothetical protein HDV03_002385 [Kappamyces sp. JEL0829]